MEETILETLPGNPDEWVSGTTKLRAALHVAGETMLDLLNNGKLPAVKVASGRPMIPWSWAVRKADIEAFLHPVKAEPEPAKSNGHTPDPESQAPAPAADSPAPPLNDLYTERLFAAINTLNVLVSQQSNLLKLWAKATEENTRAVHDATSAMDRLTSKL